MTDGIHFSLSLPLLCERKMARVLGRAAALCLCEAIGGKAAILWPGHIVTDAGTIAEAGYAWREDGVDLTFDVAASYASDTLASDVERAVTALAAGFPENGADIIQRYCNHCRTLMKFVDTTYRGMPVYGFAFAVDKFGGLMVMTQESRSVVTVYSGEAELAADEPQQPDMPLMPRV